MPSGLCIERVEVWRYALPTRRPHVMSFGTCSRVDYVAVRVWTAGGAYGWGEAATLGGPSWSEESGESVFAAVAGYLAPLVVGQDARHVALLRSRWEARVRGNSFAKAALETALLDLNARSLGISLAELLGGRVRDRLPLSWSLAAPTVDEDVAEAAELARRGHRIFKVKVGGRPVGEDLQRLATLRQAVGPDVDLRVDANQGWTRAQAFQAAARLAEFRPGFLEQPLPRADVAGLARLQARCDFPLMADESVTTLREAAELAADDAARIFSLKVAKHGGLSATLEVAALARAWGIGCYVGSMIETGVGTAACAQLAAALPALEYGCELFGPLLLADDVVEEPVKYELGFVVVPDGPGLGVEVDARKLQRLAQEHRVHRAE